MPSVCIRIIARIPRAAEVEEEGKELKRSGEELKKGEWENENMRRNEDKTQLSMMIECFVQFHTALTITGTRVYQLGETSEIRCSTEVPVQSIQWLDESSGVVRDGTSGQELVLDLTIADSHNNSRYTCRVSQGTFMKSMMITIVTRCKVLIIFLLC